jgi:hypothetical protein
MADNTMKIPGLDHPISIDANPSRVVVTVGGKVIADNIAAPSCDFPLPLPEPPTEGRKRKWEAHQFP